MNYLLYNPLSQNGQNIEKIKEIEEQYGGNVEKISVLEDEKYERVLNTVTGEDEILLVGGDGTLNHFVNKLKGKTLPCKIYFNAKGTGNDFFNDVKEKAVGDKILINDMIVNLPRVIVNGEEKCFVNGIGFGIDGYCCEVGDRITERGKVANYTAIAIKGLLFHYKTPNATITVDGVTKNYKKVWLAPTMKGRFYGGGMMVAPKQSRFDEERTVTSVVMYGSGKLKTLTVFPTIFKGEHVKHSEMVEVRKGKRVTVEFDRPTALQIDGETVLNVTKYEVFAD